MDISRVFERSVWNVFKGPKKSSQVSGDVPWTESNEMSIEMILFKSEALILWTIMVMMPSFLQPRPNRE